MLEIKRYREELAAQATREDKERKAAAKKRQQTRQRAQRRKSGCPEAKKQRWSLEAASKKNTQKWKTKKMGNGRF
eukprot:3656772-Amphidinium_carterae.1